MQVNWVQLLGVGHLVSDEFVARSIVEYQRVDLFLNLKPLLKHFVQDSKVYQVGFALLLALFAAILEDFKRFARDQVGASGLYLLRLRERVQIVKEYKPVNWNRSQEREETEKYELEDGLSSFQFLIKLIHSFISVCQRLDQAQSVIDVGNGNIASIEKAESGCENNGLGDVQDMALELIVHYQELFIQREEGKPLEWEQ